ncbi:conserved protein of unknown function [Ectopseudomonas oleovorans]|uniref:Uncharacterized protein n=1 Tax=Ectopseudomonas oleovorans TaxID=301 RepID=A0A653BAD5_ECTOL|nr:conserved protein of unknown function [Pseudomonas oleovorans]
MRLGKRWRIVSEFNSVPFALVDSRLGMLCCL